MNFLSPNLVAVFREVAKQVGKLDILASVAIESNRLWAPDHADLPVTLQKTWTSRKIVKHPGGYEEELFVHFPRDTLWQLNRMNPDCIVSLEMGMRSLLSSIYRCVWNRAARHVLAVYGSERSEAGRGLVRRWLRRRLLHSVDLITYNGPSCQRYLMSLGADPNRMTPWNYAADPSKAYRGELRRYAHGPLRILSVSQFIPRKGIVPAARILSAWAQRHPGLSIQWAIAGSGPQREELEKIKLAENLQLQLLGHQDPDQLQELYRDYPFNLFPTLGDEWGLVVDEALASGQIVLGSVHSQAAQTLIEPGKNGWLFDPEIESSLDLTLDRLLIEPEAIDKMRAYARVSVEERTHVEAANQFVTAVARAMSS